MNTSNRSFIQGGSSPALERSILLNQNKRIWRNSLFWGSVNVLAFSILLYDIFYSCPLYFSFYDYIEHVLVIVFGCNFLYHFYKIITSSLSKVEPVLITLEQKKLLGIHDADPNFKLIEKTSELNLSQTPNRVLNITSFSTPGTGLCNTPLNTTALSWRTNLSPNESLNYSLSSPSWIYHKGTSDLNMSPYPSSMKLSPSFSTKTTPVRSSSFRDTSSVEFINDESTLQQYLKEHEKIEKANKVPKAAHATSNLLNSFWSHPVTKTAKDMSSFLKKCQYQLATQSPTKLLSGSPGGKPEENKTTTQTSALEVWTRINVDTVALTQWNENLRMWISQTILERLVKEFNRINEALEKHGLIDIKIGSVGLDRLRKTAQTVQVLQYIPSLATVISFLEISTNQEYLTKRINELARGGCMSEFKWNGGSSFNGKDWDDSLPSDCAIVMHLLACYLDTQLMPLPNMPDTKAFSGHHYIRATDKMPVLTSRSLFIQQFSEKPPHYRVIVGEKVYEMVQGYNNLFHSILFFIYHVNKIEHGMLGRVNLGRAGINMLWIIDQ